MEVTAATEKSSSAPAELGAVTTSASVERETRNWRGLAESIFIRVGALLVALLAFGIFCAFAGANIFSVYHSIYRAAF